MKVYQTSEIRNLALIGGAKAGKTTLAEAMLFQGGVITRRGSVDDKNTVSDYREIELERKNSVTATVLYSEFQGIKINMIDCPGFDDFIGEVIGSLRVADTALMVVNGQSGVDVGTEIDWRWTKKMEKPVVFAINQLDHDKANFDEALRQLKHHFGQAVTVAQYPVNAGTGFDSVIDLMQMKMLKFPTNGGKVEILDIPAGEKAKAEELQGILMENAAANDESLMEIFFDKGELSEEEISRGLKAGVISRGLFPVFCVAAKTDQGTARLMESIKQICPAPNEVEGIKATNGKIIACNSSEATSLFVFKTSIEQHLGEMSMFKVVAGDINESAGLINPNTDSKS